MGSVGFTQAAPLALFQVKFLASAGFALTSCGDQSRPDRLTLQQLPELAAGGEKHARAAHITAASSFDLSW
jgi:hypothetical protein